MYCTHEDKPVLVCMACNRLTGPRPIWFKAGEILIYTAETNIGIER